MRSDRADFLERFMFLPKGAEKGRRLEKGKGAPLDRESEASDQKERTLLSPHIRIASIYPSAFLPVDKDLKLIPVA